MPRELPPLNAIRAFEAAARNLSLTKAARELHVSPGAISHQVRQLEEYFGQPLFLRQHRKVSLTSAGQVCLSAMTEGLDRIEEAVRRVGQRQKPGHVSVTVETSFAERWLVPRLSRFREAHPEIVVEVAGRPIDPASLNTKTNLAIAYGARRYHGLVIERMMSEQVFPVCSPSFRDRFGLADIADLSDQIPLLHDDTMSSNADFPDWQTFLTAQEVHDIDTADGYRFTVSSMALEAAKDGQGLVLGRGALIERDLSDGSLVAPFSKLHPQSFDYYIALLPAALEEPQVVLFRDWLLDQGRSFTPQLRLAS